MRHNPIEELSSRLGRYQIPFLAIPARGGGFEGIWGRYSAKLDMHQFTGGHSRPDAVRRAARCRKAQSWAAKALAREQLITDKAPE
jgi:hypothetical protein